MTINKLVLRRQLVQKLVLVYNNLCNNLPDSQNQKNLIRIKVMFRLELMDPVQANVASSS